MAKEEELQEGTMTFWEHLDELRTRLIRSVLAFIIGTGAAYYFKAKLFIWLTVPFVNGWRKFYGQPPSLHFGSPASAFMANVKMAVLGGAVLAVPVTLYQIWAFVAPGLYAKEKKYVLPFLLAGSLLFVGGAYFAYRFVFPAAFEFLLQEGALPKDSPVQVIPTIMIEEYLSFCVQGLLAFGAVFEIPVIIFFFTIIGLINHTHLIKFFRYFVVLAFVIAAILTPPDPLSQLLLAIPLCGLYGISIIIAYLFRKRPAVPEKTS
jgi:sec-independent protein translocase protein TatC